MCEANAYMAGPEGGQETLLMEAVDQVRPDGPDTWHLVSIFGEQKTVQGRVKYMQLVEHRLVFEPAGRP